MSKKRIWADIAGLAVGIIGGLALAELLKNLSQKKCPHCNNINEANSQSCKYCWGRLN